jgi:hypothetical protein
MNKQWPLNILHDNQPPLSKKWWIDVFRTQLYIGSILNYLPIKALKAQLKAFGIWKAEYNFRLIMIAPELYLIKTNLRRFYNFKYILFTTLIKKFAMIHRRPLILENSEALIQSYPSCTSYTCSRIPYNQSTIPSRFS